MRELDVKIVDLAPFRVASFYGYGSGPEPIAWDKLNQWASETNALQDGQEHRFFGFNNPDPSPGSPNYGYEQWVTVGPAVQPSGDMKIKEFPGGKYAVIHTTLDKIMDAWMQLHTWREQSAHPFGTHQWLEECLTPRMGEPITEEMTKEMEFNLYMPITG